MREEEGGGVKEGRKVRGEVHHDEKEDTREVAGKLSHKVH